MGWFNRLAIRNGTTGLRLVLKRIRYAEQTATEWEASGYPGMAREWQERRAKLERRFHEMRTDLDERIARERR